MNTPSLGRPAPVSNATGAAGREPVRVERYDTRLRDFGALMPFASGARPASEQDRCACGKNRGRQFCASGASHPFRQ